MMKQVFCPAKGQKMPANMTAKAELRCTGCGQVHGEAKSFFAADLQPIRTNKSKKFKKGGKSKGKSKDKKG